MTKKERKIINEAWSGIAELLGTFHFWGEVAPDHIYEKIQPLADLAGAACDIRPGVLIEQDD